jgi:membrane-bound lytic murein transglycosylase A
MMQFRRFHGDRMAIGLRFCRPFTEPLIGRLQWLSRRLLRFLLRERFVKLARVRAPMAVATLLMSAVLPPSNALAQSWRQPLSADARMQPTRFEQLPGWADDNPQEIWPAFLANCEIMRQRASSWVRPCNEAQRVDAGNPSSVRRFFEDQFVPHELTDAKGTASATITGYYEPLLRGSRTRGGPYQVPIYKAPKDLINVDLSSIYPEIRHLRLRGRLENGRVVPYPSRAEIETKQLLAGQELLWVDDIVEAFFLQVQGSGRVVLPNGEQVRVGYAEQNGYPYRSIGRWLVEKGELKLSEASMQGIKAWVAANPQRRDELLHQNPSVVFFKEIPNAGNESGPAGSMGLPLTAGRSIAVDPRYVGMGSPVFLTTQVPSPVGAGARGSGLTTTFNRLVLAQDTGSAILGPHRGDLFFGTGAEAGELAGKMKSSGKMVVLLPR